MPWSIDGPSSDQLGYTRRRTARGRGDAPRSDKRPTRLWPWIALLGGAVVLLTASLVLAPGTFHQPPIATKAAGVWRELRTAEHYRMIVEPVEGNYYNVDYPRVAGLKAFLIHDTIELVRWDNSSYIITCTLTYDPESDHLIADTNSGTFILERTE